MLIKVNKKTLPWPLALPCSPNPLQQAVFGTMGILKSYHADQLQQFNQKKLDAAATLNVGEYAHNDQLNKVEVAALMKAINMIYNLEEALIK